MKNFTHYCKTVSLFFVFSLLNHFAHSQATITTYTGVPVGVAMNGIAYGNSVYVAVGASGYIMTSPDGANWTVQKTSSFLNVTYNRVVYGNSLFVAVTSDGKIVTSPDGINWTQQTSPTSNQLIDLIYANSTFVAVGNNNTVITSTNGTAWSSVTTGAVSDDVLLSISYGAGKFVVGDRGSSNPYKVLYSTTAASGSWTSVTVTNATSLNKINWLKDKFFAFTSTTGNTDVYTSTNGTSWSVLVSARLSYPNQMFNGFSDGTKYFLCGNTSEYSYGSVITSTDGSTFTLQSQSTTVVTQNSAYVNGKYFLLGNEGLVYSADGTTWKSPAGSHLAVAYSGSRYVAVGQVTSSQAGIFTSTDWDNWTPALSTVIKVLNGVTYGGSKFVAVGNLDGSNFSTYATSADGLTWSTGNTGFTDALKSVAYGAGKYVAVGLNGRIVYSSNGTSWSSAENVSGYHYYGVSFVNNLFVAVGGSTTATTGMAKVKYSADGVTWTDVSPPSMVGHFHSVAYGNGKYMLVGRDNNSATLKFFSVTTSDITSSSGYSVAVTATTPEGDVGTLGFGGVAFNNNAFVAIANLRITPFSAYVLSSSDGTSWTATAANTTNRLRGITAAGTGFKAAGLQDLRLNITAGTLLPLKLNGFSGRDNNGTIALSWTTSYEINTDHFVTERSTDGRNFAGIGQTTAMGSVVSNDYTFTDFHPATGNAYYRLKMIDKDGKFSYSPVLKLAAAGAKGGISIYPNPSEGYFTLSLSSSQPYTATIFNNRGDKMLEKSASGSTQVIDINHLAAGIYILNVQQDGKKYTEKLIRK